ncbi:hypothetical protein RB195_019266 [Necator americanus]|uniref:Mos1 transposase HTH domain-containing protein n=1 Tax=Necator americanus TaxID=51031 RepID=A0ABR1CFY3_NECAM
MRGRELRRGEEEKKNKERKGKARAKAPSERSVRAWFQRFKAGNKELEDEPRSARPTAISFDELKNLAEQHLYEGVRCFAASLGSSLSTVSNGLRSLGMVRKLGRWLPHALSDGNRQGRSDICTQLLSRSRRFDWLDTIVTGDEKWILYVWWGVHGIYRFELLPDNTTVTADFYCAQLQRLADKIRKKHPKLGTTRIWPRATITSCDRFSITWKRSATMIVTTSKMTFWLSLPLSRTGQREHLKKRFVVILQFWFRTNEGNRNEWEDEQESRRHVMSGRAESTLS